MRNQIIGIVKEVLEPHDFDIDTFFDEIKDLIRTTSFYTTKKITYYNN
jgi:hypothetical protein